MYVRVRMCARVCVRACEHVCVWGGVHASTYTAEIPPPAFPNCIITVLRNGLICWRKLGLVGSDFLNGESAPYCNISVVTQGLVCYAGAHVGYCALPYYLRVLSLLLPNICLGFSVFLFYLFELIFLNFFYLSLI